MFHWIDALCVCTLSALIVTSFTGCGLATEGGSSSPFPFVVVSLTAISIVSDAFTPVSSVVAVSLPNAVVEVLTLTSPLTSLTLESLLLAISRTQLVLLLLSGVQLRISVDLAMVSDTDVA